MARCAAAVAPAAGAGAAFAGAPAGSRPPPLQPPPPPLLAADSDAAERKGVASADSGVRGVAPDRAEGGARAESLPLAPWAASASGPGRDVRIAGIPGVIWVEASSELVSLWFLS